MKKTKAKIVFEDERGLIQDILTKEPFEHVTFIESKTGAIRGNHYHKETVQWTYILEGKAEYHYGDPNGKQDMLILDANELVESAANESHAFKALQNTKMIVFTRGPRGGEDYEKDTYRLEKPLVS